METLGLNFYKGKTILVTGHTGFKGTWLCHILTILGANIIGVALDPKENSFFEKTKNSMALADLRKDIRNKDTFENIFQKYTQIDIVFHLAAQPLVRDSYDDPLYTYETNIMGTIHLLEALKKHNIPAVLITTDKCYKNKESSSGYIEADELGGHDPYSCSKACDELIISSYQDSFNLRVASARAGNVIGGGDFAKDRIFTDTISSLQQNEKITIRSPNAIRPWQHVLDALHGYLLLATHLVSNKAHAAAYNFGPSDTSFVTVSKLVDEIIHNWGSGSWSHHKVNDNKKETQILKLNWNKAKKELKWMPKLDFKKTIQWTVQEYKDPELYKKHIKMFLEM